MLRPLVLLLAGCVLASAARLELEEEFQDSNSTSDPFTTPPVTAPTTLPTTSAPPSYRWEWSEGAMAPCTDLVRGGAGFGVYRVNVGRVHYFDNLVPCLLQHNNDTAPAVYHIGGVIRTTTTYEALCGTGLAWVPMFHANTVPLSAVAAGYMAGGGGPLYVCRAASDADNEAPEATYVPGLVDPETTRCNITYSPSSFQPDYTAIHSTDIYEILVSVDVE